MPYTTVGRSFSGRTFDFGSDNRGSIPRRLAKPSRLLHSQFSIDGFRFIASPADWQVIRHALCHMAHQRCEKCNRYTPISYGEADHIYGRGGGKREDRIIVVQRDCTGQIIQFKKFLQWLCPLCHRAKHNQLKIS